MTSDGLGASEPGLSLDAETAEALTDGRYLFCVVPLDDAPAPADSPDESGDDERDDGVDRDGGTGHALDVVGFDGEPVTVVAAEGVGAVVQPRTRPFDADDLSGLERLLVRHQAVVDAAMEAFGTPLPVRFGTVVSGGDEGVAEWLAGACETLGEHLDALAGAREYRISVTWDEEAFADDALAADDELADLRDRIDAASEGTAFMLEKQYERRLDRLLAERRQSAAENLHERLAPLVREVQDLGKPSTQLAAAETDADLRLAVLVRTEREEDVGDVLDEVAAAGAEVRYTGPWAPYSFAPELDDPGASDDAGADRGGSAPSAHDAPADDRPANGGDGA